MTEQHITVVGLGAMGRPMAGRLVHRGYHVVAVDPSAEARARADRDGMPTFPDVASAPPSD
jgi:3-hydroxyisobutyrate dehydrogenase-like beta-hydroxyacid dehydrogenase